MRNIYKAMLITGLIYVIWLNAQGYLINRHVNTGLTHYICQLAFSLQICIYQLQNRRTLVYSLFCFLLNLLFIFQFAHHNGFWCITHPLNKKWLCDRLTEIKNKFEDHRIRWKLDGGSALGAFRDYPKNHIGIPYEKDEDIIVDTEKINLAKAILYNITLHKPWFQQASECIITITFNSTAENSTRSIKYCGTTMPVSKEIAEELRVLYGEDYMIPKMIPARIGINRHIGCAIYIDSSFEPLWIGRLYFLFHVIFFVYSVLGRKLKYSELQIFRY